MVTQTNQNFSRIEMSNDLQQFQTVWDAFLEEWPRERLPTMTLPEYTATGQDHTFTIWIESRLDKMGSIWGGSAFKFGIFSRKDKTPKANNASDSYSQDYAWYTKYASTPEDAFAKVRSLVVQVAEAAARGDYAAIDAIDLGEAYKWKIAFHYQDRQNPGVVAVFKPKRLRAWLKGKVGHIPSQTSELYRQILQLQPGKDLITLSEAVWKETAAEEPPVVVGDPATEGEGDVVEIEAPLDLPLVFPQI
jgi:5-methylcytosine-specific restriction protein B